MVSDHNVHKLIKSGRSGGLIVQSFSRAVVIVLFLLVLSICAGSADTRSFYAGFNGTADAVSSVGSPKPSSASSDFIFADGISGKSIVVGPASLSYAAKGNMDPVQGSISLWVQPQNWDSNSQSLIPIFWLGNAHAYYMHYYLLYRFTPTGEKTLTFRSRLDPDSNAENVIQEEITRVLKNPEAVFSKNEWTHIVCTWTTWELFVYVNGQLFGHLPYSMPVQVPPLKEDERFWIADNSFWDINTDLVTKVDELEIFNKALTADEVSIMYNSRKSSLKSLVVPGTIPVPKSSAKPVVDGKLGKAEWADATRVPVNKLFAHSSFASIPAWCYLKYDQQNLYIAFEVLHNSPLRPAGKGRDMKLFSGDEAEVTLRTPGGQGYYQFAVAPNGAYAYGNGGEYPEARDWDWKGSFKSGVSREAGVWYAEMAIPFADLQAVPEAAKPWLIQLGLHRPSEESLGGESERWMGYGGGEDMYQRVSTMPNLCFYPDGTAVRVEEMGDINAGRLTASFSARGAGLTAKMDIQRPEAKLSTFEAVLNEKPSVLRIGNRALGEGLIRLSVTRNNEQEPIFLYDSLYYAKASLVISSVCHAKARVLDISTDMTGASDLVQRKVKSGRISGTATLVSTKGKEFGRLAFTQTKLQAVVHMPFQDLPVGKYDIRVIMTDRQDTFKASLPLEKPDALFLTAKAGVDRTVPAPWTPLKASGNTISVWGRDYVFADGPFIAKAASNGKSVISRPAEMTATIAGKPRRFIAVEQKITDNGQDKIIHTGKCEVQGGGLTMLWKRTVEFDGMIRYDVNLVPGKTPFKLDTLEFEMRVPMASAMFLLSPQYLSDWAKTKKHSAMPGDSLWFTGRNSGMEFFTVSDANWVYKENSKPISVYQDGDDAVIKCRIISGPVSVTKKLSYTLGMMATPVRPHRPDWRSVHAEGWGRPARQNLQCYTQYAQSQKIQWLNGVILTDMLNEKSGLEELAEWKSRGVGVVPYTLDGNTADNNPYYDYFGADWAVIIGGREAPKSFRTSQPWLTQNGKDFYMCSSVCDNSTYADFLAWCTQHYMSKYPFVGTYNDGCGATSCDSPYHGCKVIDAFGRVAKTYNYLSVRELNKRLYKIVHKIRPNGFHWIHTGATGMPYMTSMYDLQLMGEDYLNSAPVNPNIYTDEEDALEKWQSQHNGNLKGTVYVFHGLSRPRTEDQNAPPSNPNLWRPLFTMSLLHDVNQDGGWIYGPTIDKLWRIIDVTELDKAEFVGYWENKEITSDNPKVLVSYYKWAGQNKLLVIAGSINPEPQSAKLQFKGSLSVPMTDATDMWLDKPIDMSAGISLADRDFRAVLVKW